MLYSFLTLATVAFSSGVPHYDYSGTDGPAEWAQRHDTQCDGNRQSPINYVTNNAIPNPTQYACGSQQSKLFSVNKLKDHENWKVENNGHSLLIYPINGEGGSKLGAADAVLKMVRTIGSGTNHPLYCLDSMHLHWGTSDSEGSEHFKNNQQYSAEMHYVMYSCDTNNGGFADLAAATTQLTGDNTVAVVSVLFEAGKDTENEAFKDIIEHEDFKNLFVAEGELEMESSHALSFLVNDIENGGSADEHLQNILTEIYQYEGSFTTPECNEIVWWHMFATPQPISDEQMDALRNFEYEQSPEEKAANKAPLKFSDVGNFRPLTGLTNTKSLFSNQCTGGGEDGGDSDSR